MERPQCGVCGRRAEVTMRYRTDHGIFRLCLGCVGSYRLHGREVHAVERLREEMEQQR